ncbi:hypothetical protein [Rachiplusia nu nucleopolyhedrovirus]|uniref:PARG catalytic Macro domain-containing protein n=1 Tax=Rachiplusia nu nucleopolyhedrovirus TaxID=2605775 RepID=A0AAE6IQT1_9ABAC|nr:hypothetical protein QKQ55_gp098 [Rachiplusia nu nucleopolyhedrovirus]QEI03688.1 hypothetical protein [Rachiplusia nu nucleopolyhedrovirus]
MESFIILDSFIIQYVSLQDSILATFNSLNSLSNDLRTNNITQFSEISNRLKQHQQSFRDLKRQLGNVIYDEKSNLSRNYLMESINYDEKTIDEAIELIDHIKTNVPIVFKSPSTVSAKINVSDFAQLSSAETMTTPFNTVPDIKFIEIMRSYLGDVTSGEILYSEILQEEDFKYQVEFEIILRKSISGIGLYRDMDLNRVDCLTIITQAFFLNNVRDLDFSNIKRNDTPIKREKIICLFTYFIAMFSYMRESMCPALYKPIIIQHNQTDFTAIEQIRTANKNVNPSNVNIEEFTAIHKYYKHRTFRSYDLIVDYAEKKIGNYALTDSANYEDVMFMKYPELYAVSYFINKDKSQVFADNDSYLISNIIQFNLVKNAMQQSKHMNNAPDLFGITYVNIVAFESCDLKVHLGSRQSDKAHLDRMILKLYSGLLLNRNTRRFNNDIEDEPDAFIRLHAGSGINDCTENKTFQFLIELLVCTVLNYQLCYCVRSFEQLSELNDTVEAVGRMNAAELYFKLVNYDFSTTGPVNFQSSEA